MTDRGVEIYVSGLTYSCSDFYPTSPELCSSGDIEKCASSEEERTDCLRRLSCDVFAKLAGVVAHAEITPSKSVGRAIGWGGQEDRRLAKLRIASMGYPANLLPAVYDDYVERTRQLIREFWVGVDLLALELRRRYRLECEEVVDLVKPLIPSPEDTLKRIMGVEFVK